MNNICSRKKLQFLIKLILILLIVNYFGYFLINNYNSNNKGASLVLTSNEDAIKQQPNNKNEEDKIKFDQFLVKRLQLINKTSNIENANSNNDNNEYVNRKRFYAIDGNGMASVNTEIIQCGNNIEVEVVKENKKH